MTVPYRASPVAMVVAVVLVVGLGACRAESSASDGDLPTATSDPAASSTTAPGVDPQCNDTVPDSNDPDAEDEHTGTDRGFYGVGDVWMFLPTTAADRWSDLVDDLDEAGSEFSGKFPIDVRGTDEVPRISAALEPDGAPVVEGTANPTTEGLPGPLPASVVFPRAGCWKVMVEGTEGRISFLVDVG